MEKVHKKLDGLDSRLDNIDKTLVKQEANLEEHMRRTDQIEEELGPVVKHVEQMRGAGKLLGLIAIFATIIGIFMEIF